jgi:hypothetical protein
LFGASGLLEEQRNTARFKLAEILLAEIDNGAGMCVHGVNGQVNMHMRI